MIDLFAVTDHLEVYGQQVTLLEDLDFHLPAGRYALLSPTPEYNRPVIDLLAGIRPPHRGRVEISRSISWPIGRPAMVRGHANGLAVINLIADLYDVDRNGAADVVTMLVSRPDTIGQPMETWPPYVRQEFIFALGLVPEFDIYVIDAPVPFEDARFTRLWQALFEERLVGKSLILSSHRPKQLLDYCARALVHDAGGLAIEHDLEQAIERYPARPARVELRGMTDGGSFDDAAYFY